jgi:Domain of unknown function (DUF6089)
MKMKFFAIIGLVLLCNVANAQYQYLEYVQKGEFGITLGAAHYFGDLNTRAGLNRPKPAVGVFFRKQFGNYVAARLNAHYAQVGYSDTYSKNDYQKTRNLSFNSNIWELTLQGDFNFFRFIPGTKEYAFTPYVTVGIGAFSYDPYAYLNGEKQYLRTLGTEGQLTGYKGRKQYSPTGICIPIGVGLKFNLSEKINFTMEVTQRLTNTDYLDDVSTTYAGIANFTPGSTASLLQDRSYELDPTNVLGKEGRQRGFSKQKDQYIIAEIGLSFNISSYRCPSAN